MKIKNKTKRLVKCVTMLINVKIRFSLFVGFLLLNNIGSAKEIFLIKNKVIIFLNAKEGYNYVNESDHIKNLTKLDIELRLEKNLFDQDLKNCQELYWEYHKKQFRQWSYFDKRFVIKRLKNAYYKIDSVTPSVIPDTLYLIRTTGKQEFKGFYTYKKAIICPKTIRTSSTYFLMFAYVRNYIERVFIHELLHVYSNNHPEVRDSLYNLVGFERINNLKLIPSIEKKLIHNPDDKSGYYKITLIEKGSHIEKDYCLLILSKYDKWEGYIDFPGRLNVLIVYIGEGLHQIKNNGGYWESAIENKVPIIKKGKDFQDYYKKVGLEQYSPEEIVVHLFIDLIQSRFDKEILDNKSNNYKSLLTKLKVILNSK